VAALNADGTFGRWRYVIAKKAADVAPAIEASSI
jgi:hypothetical protein